MTLRYLLDTHVLLWALRDPDALAPAAREAIAAAANPIHVSEIARYPVDRLQC